MSIAVRCPNQECGHLVRVAASLRGEHIQCPACGAGLRIPEADREPALDDTPTDLNALPDAPETPAEKRSARRAARRGGVATGDRIADGAAAVTSAASPVLKLVATVVVLAGLIVLGTKVIFPMLWSGKQITSVPDSEGTAIEEIVSGSELPSAPEQRTLEDKTRARILEAIESRDFVGAQSLLRDAEGDPVHAADIDNLRSKFRAALNERFKRIYQEVDEHIANRKWEEARSKLREIQILDETESHKRSYNDRHNGINSGEASDLVDTSKQAAAKKDFEAASKLVEDALFLYRTDSEVKDWSNELRELMGSGITLRTGGVVAEVFFDGARVGDTSRTIWQLPANKRIRLRLQAPDYVPRDTIMSLQRYRAKEHQVRLVRAAPEALWVARLVSTDALRWLACRAVPHDTPAMRNYCDALARQCTSVKLEPKKRKVWRIRMGGKTVFGLEYSTLGKTVRFVNLETGRTTRTTTDKVKATELSLQDGARKWLSHIEAGAESPSDPCKAFIEYGRYVAVFPDKIDVVTRRSGPRIATLVRAIAELVSCESGAGERRDSMDILDRLNAEIDAWERAGLEPPKALLEQKRNRP